MKTEVVDYVNLDRLLLINPCTKCKKDTSWVYAYDSPCAIHLRCEECNKLTNEDKEGYDTYRICA